jgi:hypothetical protein
MSARPDVLESIAAATERVFTALEWADNDEARLELSFALVDLRVAKRQAEELPDVRPRPPRADAVFTRSGSRKGKVRA